MNCWEILETQPTLDNRDIKKAYTRLLRKFPPESDPQGFQSLRAAYEEALFFARFNLAYQASKESQDALVGKPDSEAALLPGDPDATAQSYGLDSSPETASGQPDGRSATGPANPGDDQVETLLAKVEKDFPNHDLRQSEAYWRDLTNSELLWNLSAKAHLRMRLFQFLGERYLEFKDRYTNAHVPREAWKLLDEEFGWLENEGELYACFPEDLANAVLDRIRAARDLAMSTDLPGEYRATRGLLVEEGTDPAGNYRWLGYLAWVIIMAAANGIFRCS